MLHDAVGGYYGGEGVALFIAGKEVHCLRK